MENDETESNLEKNVALLVDGPNMQGCNFADIISAAKDYGQLWIMEIFFNKYANPKLIEAALNNGYEPVINTIEDVDTSMVARATELICSPRYQKIDVIALATRDGDYCPVAFMARNYHKFTLAIGKEGEGESKALAAVVDKYVNVQQKLLVR